MSCIKTRSGIMFDPLAPKADQIIITDIAHSLSMLCRANGHFKHFYSVGQHCINCAKEAAARGYSIRLQLACLLHDGSEAYLSDVTRPVKAEIPKYLEIEEPLQDAIWLKFLGTPLTKEETKAFYSDILTSEAAEEYNLILEVEEVAESDLGIVKEHGFYDETMNYYFVYIYSTESAEK